MSEEEAKRYEDSFARGDNNDTPPVTKMSPETIRREERLNDVVETPLFRAGAPSEDEQGYLLDEMLATLGDV